MIWWQAAAHTLLLSLGSDHMVDAQPMPVFLYVTGTSSRASHCYVPGSLGEISPSAKRDWHPLSLLFEQQAGNRLRIDAQGRAAGMSIAVTAQSGSCQRQAS
jgi:hypothetical protein